MADPEKQQPAWQKAARVALIPCLVVVLLIVCLWPAGETTTELVDPGSSLPAKNGDQASGTTTSPRSSQMVSTDRRRPQVAPIALDLILQHDPFMVSAEVSQELRIAESQSQEEQAAEVRARVDDMIELLQAGKLNVLLRGEKGVSAILGDRVLHEGDEIDPGVRIRKITAKGLTLEVDESYDPERSED